MSTAVFPTLAGQGWSITRTPMWSAQPQESVSGKEYRLSLYTYPRYKWDLVFNILRSDSVNAEYQNLIGFYNARQGQVDSFLYADADDNAVTSQAIGTGDGSTKTFQLIRTLGGFIEPVLAPHTVSHVYNNGTDSGGWSVSNWGTSTPGVITYGTAPAAGHAITADFTYYWPCRFVDSSVSFELFMTQYYQVKKLSFQSVKN